MRLVGKGSKAEKQTSANRAEELRQKRGERSQKRVSEATKRAGHPVRVRPVVVRGGEFGTPIHQRAARKSPRRTFYVTMDSAAGTEMRLPALPTFHASWRILSSIIAVAALFGIYSMWNADMFRVTAVRMQGFERISAEEINKELNLEMLSIVEIDTHAIRQQMIDTYPELVGVRVSAKLPNVVEVAASERKPVIAWKKGKEVTWLDEEGYAFPVRGKASGLITLQTEEDLPLAAPPTVTLDELTSGTKPTETPIDVPRKVKPELIQATKLLSEKLPAKTRLIYSADHGLGWIDKAGWQVYIGTDLETFEERYLMYQALASHLKDQGLTPTLVSVEHMNAPFYRLEP